MGSGSAALFAEKLCFSERRSNQPAAMPPAEAKPQKVFERLPVNQRFTANGAAKPQENLFPKGHSYEERTMEESCLNYYFIRQ
jgi:hypothetical protein